MTAPGNSEAGYIDVSEVVEDGVVLRQEQPNFMELSMMILHVHRRAGLNISM